MIILAITRSNIHARYLATTYKSTVQPLHVNAAVAAFYIHTSAPESIADALILDGNVLSVEKLDHSRVLDAEDIVDRMIETYEMCVTGDAIPSGAGGIIVEMYDEALEDTPPWSDPALRKLKDGTWVTIIG